MTLIYDLHSHSTASDGTLPPEELVRHAVEQGVDVLALTDHDTTAGLEAAAAAAQEVDLRLVPGIEVSVTWRNQTVHLIGLNIDSGCAALQEGVAALRAFRAWRAEEIGRRLAKAGIEGAYDGARALAGESAVSRTHFARFLVERGRAKDVGQVFKHFLVRNKPGYVPGKWAVLEEAVGWIVAAGGQAVVAHPARYRFTATRLRELLGEFRECGGVGLEVVSSSHNREERAAMAALAAQFRLKASAGSDFHSPGNAFVELGRRLELPGGCDPIWADWGLEQKTANHGGV